MKAFYLFNYVSSFIEKNNKSKNNSDKEEFQTS